MRVAKQVVLWAVAGVLPSVGVPAEDPDRPIEGVVAKVVYEGVDAQGRVVRLTMSDVRVEVFRQVSPPPAERHPEPHWTSRIGTGTAAALER